MQMHYFFLNKIAYFFVVVWISRVILRKKAVSCWKSQYFVKYFTFLLRRKILRSRIYIFANVRWINELIPISGLKHIMTSTVSRSESFRLFLCYLKDKVYSRPFISVEDLKERIKLYCSNINYDLNSVMKNVKKRCMKCVQSEGGTFKHFL